MLALITVLAAAIALRAGVPAEVGIAVSLALVGMRQERIRRRRG